MDEKKKPLFRWVFSKKKDLFRKLYGNITMVGFSSEYTTRIFLRNNISIFQDPVVTLFHELIHGFHNLYDYYLNRVVENEYDLAEIITHGARRVKFFQKSY